MKPLNRLLPLVLAAAFLSTHAFIIVGIHSGTQMYEYDNTLASEVTTATPADLFVTLHIVHSETQGERFYFYGEFTDAPLSYASFFVMFKPAANTTFDAVQMEWSADTFSISDNYQTSWAGQPDFVSDTQQDWSLDGTDSFTCDTNLCYVNIYAYRELDTGDEQDYAIDCNLEYQIGISSDLQTKIWTSWTDPVGTCNAYLSNTALVADLIKFDLFLGSSDTITVLVINESDPTCIVNY